MDSFALVLLISFSGCMLACAVGVGLGQVVLPRSRVLQAIGGFFYAMKTRMLDRRWPLTRYKRAMANNQLAVGSLILAPLILVKTIACVVAGVIALAWLPVASFIMPSLVAKAGLRDKSRAWRWIGLIMLTQGTSHVLAAAVGFTIAWFHFMGDQPITEIIAEHAVLISAGLLVVTALAIVAGWLEAYAHIRVGILNDEAIL